MWLLGMEPGSHVGTASVFNLNPLSSPSTIFYEELQKNKSAPNETDNTVNLLGPRRT